jgi:anti-anti-sigma factor
MTAVLGCIEEVLATLVSRAVWSERKENIVQITEGDFEAGRVLQLSGELRMNDAEQLRAALLDFMCATSRPVVDLSAVTACDTAGLQLLISACHTAERSAKILRVVGVPAAIQRAEAALGVSITALPNIEVAGAPEGCWNPGQASEAA